MSGALYTVPGGRLSCVRHAARKRTTVHAMAGLSRAELAASASFAVSAMKVFEADRQRTQLFPKVDLPSSLSILIPFASSSFGVQTQSSSELYLMLSKAVKAVLKAVNVYQTILFIRVLLTWFKNINWYKEPFQTLRVFTDPFLSMFSRVIPPVGGIDLSPMIGFFLLNCLGNYLRSLA